MFMPSASSMCSYFKIKKRIKQEEIAQQRKRRSRLEVSDKVNDNQRRHKIRVENGRNFFSIRSDWVQIFWEGKDVKARLC